MRASEDQVNLEDEVQWCGSQAGTSGPAGIHSSSNIIDLPQQPTFRYGGGGGGGGPARHPWGASSCEIGPAVDEDVARHKALPGRSPLSMLTATSRGAGLGVMAGGPTPAGSTSLRRPRSVVGACSPASLAVAGPGVVARSPPPRSTSLGRPTLSPGSGDSALPWRLQAASSGLGAASAVGLRWYRDAVELVAGVIKDVEAQARSIQVTLNPTLALHLNPTLAPPLNPTLAPSLNPTLAPPLNPTPLALQP